MEILIVIAGSIASVVGAAFSVWFALKAKTSSEVARDAVGRIIQKDLIAVLSSIEAQGRRALSAMKKYGPGVRPTSLSGIDHGEDGQEAQEFLQVMKEHKDLFESKIEEEITILCEELEDSLSNFSNEDDLIEIKRLGHKMWSIIGDQLSQIRKVIRRETQSLP